MMEFADKVRENRVLFDGMVAAALRECDAERSIALAIDAARFASLCGVGLMSSSALERKLMAIAESLDDLESCMGAVGGTLLVATELYPVGGHTKVLERLAEMLKGDGRLSLVLTSSSNKFVPDVIRNAVMMSGGMVVLLDDATVTDKALRLRSIAMAYDREILMVHPEDAMPVVAFGTNRFKRPVFYYNHANHTFWLGVGIADRVLDVNKWGVSLSCKLRGVKPGCIESLGIPLVDVVTRVADGSAVRHELGLCNGESLVTAAGSPRKFRNFGKWRFGDFIEQILEKNSTTSFLVIGVGSSAYPEWRRIRSRFGRRFILVPPMPHGRLLEHFAASDVVVDSFPMSGWTSMMDAVRQKTATVYPAGVTGPMDYFADSSSFAADAMTAAAIVGRLLNDKDFRAANISDMSERVRMAADSESFSRRLHASFDAVSEHTIHEFVEVDEPYESPLSQFVYAMTVRRKVKFSMLGISLCSVREGASKYRELSLFGGKLVWRL